MLNIATFLILMIPSENPTFSLIAEFKSMSECRQAQVMAVKAVKSEYRAQAEKSFACIQLVEQKKVKEQ